MESGTLKKYRHKSILGEEYGVMAVQWTGNNMEEVRNMCGASPLIHDTYTNAIIMPTKHGNEIAQIGDFFVKMDEITVVLEQKYFLEWYVEVPSGIPTCNQWEPMRSLAEVWE